MNQRRHLTIIAAVTSLMAAAPLTVLFEQWTWVIDAAIAVIGICAANLAARALRAPVWAQPLAGLTALLFMLTWINSSGHEFLGIIPSLDTLRHFRDLTTSAGDDMRNLAIPVFDRPGLLFLATAGVGVVAILVDFVAVGLRRPALAGLPMLAVYTVPVAIDPGSVSFLPFAIGAGGYMWLLVTDNIDRVRLFGRRFTGEGRGVDMWEPSPLASVGRRIAVVGVLLAIVIPVATPGLTSGLFGHLGTGIGIGNGNGSCNGCIGGNTVNLFANLSGQLNQSKPQLMVTVSTDDNNPGYLRFGVADQLTRAGFTSSQPVGQSVDQGLPNPPFSDPGGGAQPVDFEHHHADVTIVNLDIRELPIYVAPTTGSLTRVPTVWSYDPATSVVFATDASSSNLNYGFDYDRAVPNPDELRLAQRLPATNPIQASMTKVPVDVPQIDQVLRSQLGTATNEYDKVLNLYEYFSARNGFTYALSTKAGTTGTDVGDFLVNKQGYCVQYAATLAWLVRAAGYPARVAFGFTEGQLEATGVHDLTNLNLHAWTEVYFQGYGWIPFDATPAGGVPGSIRTAWAPNADPTTGGGAEPSLSGSGGTGPGGSGTGNGLGGKVRDPGQGGGNVGGSGSAETDWTLWILGVLLAALVLAALPSVARVLLRNRRAAAERRTGGVPATPGEPWVLVDGGTGATLTRRRVHVIWDEFLDTLVDYQVPVDPAETPRSAAERVSVTMHLPTEAATQVRLLGASEEQARYARTPATDGPQPSDLRLIRHALASHVSTRTKLRAVLMPPSVTKRWSANAMATVARTVSRSQAMRDVFLRTVSIRRWFAGRRPLAERSGP